MLSLEEVEEILSKHYGKKISIIEVDTKKEVQDDELFSISEISSVEEFEEKESIKNIVDAEKEEGELYSDINSDESIPEDNVQIEETPVIESIKSNPKPMKHICEMDSNMNLNYVEEKLSIARYLASNQKESIKNPRKDYNVPTTEFVSKISEPIIFDKKAESNMTLEYVEKQLAFARAKYKPNSERESSNKPPYVSKISEPIILDKTALNRALHTKSKDLKTNKGRKVVNKIKKKDSR